MTRRLILLACGPVIRCGLAVVAVLASSTGVPGEEMGLFAKYDWINGAEDISGSRLRHDGVLDPGITVSHGRVHLEGCDGVDLGYMPELDGAQEVLLRFEDVTLKEYPDGTIDYYAILSGGADHTVGTDWSLGMRVDDPDHLGEPWQTSLFFRVTGWGLLYGVPALTGETLESVNHFESMEFRFTAAAPASERLAIRWNDGAWVTGGSGGGSILGFPSSFPVRLNDGYRTDWDPVWADLGPVSFYSDRANVPEPGSFVLILGVAAISILWQSRRIRRSKSSA